MPDPSRDPVADEEGFPGTPTVLYRVDDGVARITINRPERRNAMSWEVMRGLRRTIAAAAEARDVKVVVLAGAGDEAFCAGADLGKMTGADEPDSGMLAVHEERGVLA
ncbi:MAG TPA: enoyl-CoA hydratase/isomerase family protein, partial [Acidimicrobiales bacterium]|nr:enoyl-CoA hydratase/isomerase family protein [Acidimicrobiales bacterium]